MHARRGHEGAGLLFRRDQGEHRLVKNFTMSPARGRGDPGVMGADLRLFEHPRGVALGRAYRAVAAVFLAALLVSLGFYSLRISLGLASGCALGLGILASWQLIVSRAFTPSAPRRGLALLVGFLKLPLIGAIVYALVGRDLVSPAAFAAGFAIPQVSILLLAVGGFGAARTDRNPERAIHAAPRA